MATVDLGDTTNLGNALVVMRKCCGDKTVWECQLDPPLIVPTITLHPVFVELVCGRELYALRILQATCPVCGVLYQGWDVEVSAWR